jgi:ribonuclease HI
MPVSIRSDSKYVVESYNNWYHNWIKANDRTKKNFEMWLEVKSLELFLKEAQINFKVKWVPRAQNSKADELSK